MASGGTARASFAFRSSELATLSDLGRAMLIRIRIRIRIRTVSALAILLALTNVSQANDGEASASSRPPNVILIMADDLGYGDLGCYGNEIIKTPVLDRMGAEGLRLTSFYAGCSVCTPSRMALMTGAHPARVGWPGGVMGYKIDWSNGLAPEALTMPEVFQSSGYATGMCGKWHLGNDAPMRPMSQGFDSAYYIKSSNNQTKKLWFDEKLIADPFDNRRLTEKFTASAIEFIQTNHDGPFFLYVPFSAPHFPAQAHPDWKGKSKLGAYGDVVEEMDSRIGQILDALQEHELDDRTIVIFTSDNGPEPGQKEWARASPFRGLKWSSLEGGNRVPCVVRWPGVIAEGRVCDEMISSVDLLPTLAQACGIDLAAISTSTPNVDGVNVWDTMIDKPDNKHARSDLLFWSGWATPQAIRVHDWKLYFDHVKKVKGSDKRPVLINLAEDPAERTNLSARYPEKVREMMELALERLADIEVDTMTLGGPAISTKPTKKRPRWLK